MQLAAAPGAGRLLSRLHNSAAFQLTQPIPYQALRGHLRVLVGDHCRRQRVAASLTERAQDARVVGSARRAVAEGCDEPVASGCVASGDMSSRARGQCSTAARLHKRYSAVGAT